MIAHVPSTPVVLGSELKDRIRQRLLAESEENADASEVARRAPTRADVAARLAELARDAAPLLSESALASLVADLVADTVGLGPLEALLADPEVSEVMVNGPDSVWIERQGRLHRVPLALPSETIGALIERIVAPIGLRVDRSSPLVDARLPDGSRVNAIVPPVALDGPCLTIRRFAARSIPLAAFAPAPLAGALAAAVRARRSILVSGGTGSGKTTLLNALAAEIPGEERLITIEDAAELRLPGPHVVRLEARPANADGQGAVTIRDLVRNALRMRPDRIIVGEVRGGEALDMVQAMNTGHEGSLSTCHANSADDALRRLEVMMLMAAVDLPLSAVRQQILSALDLVVHVARTPEGGRAIDHVASVEPGPDGPVAHVHEAGGR